MDTLSPTERSARMARVKGKGSSAELTIRRLVHRLGYRYRLHGGKLPGRPDLVFPGRKKVIFVHGCFWHRHPDPDCKLARLPKSRHEFWVPKLEGNRARDLRQLAALQGFANCARPPQSPIFLTNGLGFLGRRWAPGVSRGPFCFLGEDFQAVRRQLGPYDIERPVLLVWTQRLQPNRPRHQIGQLQAG